MPTMQNNPSKNRTYNSALNRSNPTSI